MYIWSVVFAMQSSVVPEFVLTQYHYTKWPKSGKPTKPGQLVRLVENLIKTQSNTGNNPITVMCRLVGGQHPEIGSGGSLLGCNVVTLLPSFFPLFVFSFPSPFPLSFLSQ